MRLDLDLPVNCSDAHYGELTDVVIDPHARRLTHLVVKPRDDHGHVRLVPLASADRRGRAGSVALTLTAAEISHLDSIQEFAYLDAGESPVSPEGWDVGIRDMYELPAPGALGPQALGAEMGFDYDQHVAMTYHCVPSGSVELRRDSSVTSCDGHYLGHVVGFVLDDQGGIEALVLGHGHLWGKRQVAIPANAIERLVSDEVTLNLSHEAVGNLKPLK